MESAWTRLGANYSNHHRSQFLLFKVSVGQLQFVVKQLTMFIRVSVYVSNCETLLVNCGLLGLNHGQRPE